MGLFKRTESLLLPGGITFRHAFTALIEYQKTKQIARDHGLWRTPVEPTESPLVYLHFNDSAIATRDLGRYLYLLVMFLRRNGYRVALGGGFFTISGLQTKFGKLLLGRRLVQFPNPGDGKISARLCITDDDRPPDHVAYDAHLRVVTGVKLTTTADSYDILFPYMLHPTYYDWEYDLNLDEWRREKRSVKVLFSGNMGSRYSNSLIWERYGKQSRMEVVSTLLQGLEGEETNFIATETELPGLLAQDDGGFVCIDNSKGFRIPKREWLSFLGKTNFQVCAPGVDMPLCHNLVEGMSVGCIPILEYSVYFDPPLKHYSECIVFSGKEELLSAVRRCLNMEEDEIRPMRRGVLDYYDTHLRPEAFGQKLVGLQKRNTRLGMNFIHDQFERRYWCV